MPRHDEMQVAAAFRRQLDLEDVVGLGLGRQDLAQHRAIARVALGLQDVDREGGVPRRHPRSVVEPRFGTQQEAVGELVGRPAHLMGEEAVEPVRVVAGTGHQAVEGRVHAGRAVALEDEDVERVEGVEVLVAGAALDLECERAALRRRRIDVAEVPEVWQGISARRTSRAHAIRSRLPRQARGRGG